MRNCTSDLKIETNIDTCREKLRPGNGNNDEENT